MNKNSVKYLLLSLPLIVLLIFDIIMLGLVATAEEPPKYSTGGVVMLDPNATDERPSEGPGSSPGVTVAGSIGAVVTASAASLDEKNHDSAQTTVTYSVDTTWKLTIPDSITVGDTAGGKVEASDVVIEKGKQFKVTVSSNGEWKVSGNGQSIEYDLKVDDSSDALTNGGEVLTLDAGTQSGEATLKASLKNADDGKYSTGGDTYTDTLTFTITDGTEG